MSRLTTFNKVTLDEITTPTPLVGYGSVYTKSDGKLYFQDGAAGSEKIVSTTPIVKEVFLSSTNYANDNSDYRTKAVSATGGARFTFKIPDDFNSLTSIYLIGQVSVGAAGSGKNIDLSSDYGAAGEALNQHSETDTTTTYDFTGYSGQNNSIIDLSVVLSSLAAGDYVGIFVDHNAIGGGIDYLGIKLLYTT